MDELSLRGFNRKLSMFIDTTEDTVRALTPRSFDYRPKAGGPTVETVIRRMLKLAGVLKMVIQEGDGAVPEVKTPSFTSPDEAADTLRSALRGALEEVDRCSKVGWLASVNLEGSKWRGETRASIAPSLLADLNREHEVLLGVVQEIERAAEPAPSDLF